MANRDIEGVDLDALGFGPDSLLANEPRLFVDRRFLAALTAELYDELGEPIAHVALFKIGLMHGLRDACRVLDGSFLTRPDLGASPATAPPLAITLGRHGRDECTGGVEIFGAWPERHEAEARLSKLGPATAPSCHLSAGYTSGWLSGTLGNDVLAIEHECAAQGGAACSFTVREPDSWRERDDGWAAELVRSISLASHRESQVQEPPPLEVEGNPLASFDPEAPAVHVWGPVMVLPFHHADEALRTADRLGRDPETAAVRVVVLDLRGEPVDEGFGAAALEQMLESIEAWGAETILTGVSPFSQSLVADLEREHLLMRKDLPEAIATAFQIAEAQRHLL